MMQFNDIEQRVLGVLMEKSLTQPDTYPLTLNAIVLGANQKQNRDPVREFSEREVSDGLRSLELKKVVVQAPPMMGARSVRFQHRVVELFSWDRREQAVMAELMLRGRQTAGELRTHAGRMTPFADLEAIHVTMAGLQRADTRFVEELPREPGRSANRFRHLMSAESDSSEAGERPGTPVVFASPERAGSADLESRVVRLEEALARLESRVEMLSTNGGRSIDESPSVSV